MQEKSYRSTWADVHVARITQNVRTFKQHLDTDTIFMAVIKADGYGHGAIETALAALAGGAGYLGVAIVDEALTLREAGIDAPILLLSPIEKEAVLTAVENDLSITVFTKDIAEEVILRQKETKKHVRVHLKIDTGMSRIGIRTKEETMELLHLLKEGGIEVEGIFTHFADAENLADPSFTYGQYQTFMDIVQYAEDQGIHFSIRHCCNTAATLGFSELQLDMVRVGIGLYGLFPTMDFLGRLPLKPVMDFKTRILYLKDIPKNQTVGYGRTYTAPFQKEIATIPVGYADGYPRQLSNKGYVSIQNQRVPVVGLVCMDQTMLDVSSLSSIDMLEEVTLFGDSENSAVTPYDIAEWTGTTHYDVICAVGKRVPRVYIR